MRARCSWSPSTGLAPWANLVGYGYFFLNELGKQHMNEKELLYQLFNYEHLHLISAQAPPLLCFRAWRPIYL